MGECLVGGVEGSAQLVRQVAGVRQLGRCEVDEVVWVGVVVRVQACGVVVVTQPTVELIEQLR
jgi:hypothetical protein